MSKFCPRSRQTTVAACVALLISTVFGISTARADLSATTPGSEAPRFGLLDAGEYYACGVNVGDIMCWGFATFSDRYGVPTALTVGGNPFRVDSVIDLDVGGTYFDDGATSCIVGNSGSVIGGVWCWGGNFYGQFGNGTTSAQEANNPPVRAFGNLTGATRVAVGQNHVCVLKSDSTVVCSGQNTSGQLGNGTNNNSSSPVTVSTGSSALSGVTAISAGLYTSCVLITGGDTWCWGDSTYYQLGNASSNSSNVAVHALYNPSGSTAIEVAGTAVCTIGSYGMQCWGETTRSGSNITNTERLGTASGSANVWVPSPVTAINFTPTAMAMGLAHTCALNSIGEVWCFGNNDSGMLGNGNTTDSATAVKVNLPGPVDVIAAGIVSTCAVNQAGAMWCWGDGTNYALANNSYAVRSTPVANTTRAANWTYMANAPTTTIATTTLAPTTTLTATTIAVTTTTVASNSQSATTTTLTASPTNAQSGTTTTAPAEASTTSTPALPRTGQNSTFYVIAIFASLFAGLILTAYATRPKVLSSN